jgi:DNA (cytosine-5)-methyltransferase 1
VKGAKDEDRTHPSGAHYRYKEGALPFPDPLDRPSRTILTSEGGASPSRTTHCVEQAPGVFRRLTPVELERLDGFPDGWTELRAPGKTLSNGQRGFILGNALVVGIIERIARELEKTV